MDKMFIPGVYVIIDGLEGVYLIIDVDRPEYSFLSDKEMVFHLINVDTDEEIIMLENEFKKSAKLY